MSEVTEAAATTRRLPAEWEPHAGTWIAWPHQRQDWPGKFGPIPWVFAEIVRLVSEVEPVWVLVRKKAHRARVLDILEHAGAKMDAVTIIKHKTDRCWLRDSGPMIAYQPDGSPVVLDWKFNAWAKYPNHRDDNRVSKIASRVLDLPRVKPRAPSGDEPARIVLEGGAIDSNGRGTLLTTEECLLSGEQERNPGLDRAGYERVFAEEMGIRKTIWLGRGIVGDDTHGHIDDLARFVNPTTVVCVEEKDPADPNYESTRENLARLREARDAGGDLLAVVPLPMPRPVIFEGQRLPASYANFYIINGRVLVPTFNDPNDRAALSILADVFPDREVIGVHAVDLVWGLGTLHCLARDVPALSTKMVDNGEREVDPDPEIGEKSSVAD